MRRMWELEDKSASLRIVSFTVMTEYFITMIQRHDDKMSNE